MKCFYDGFEFSGDNCTYPTKYDLSTHMFTMSTLTFCSYSCVKAYLRLDTTKGNQLNLFSLYLRREHHILTCVTALPKDLLKAYHTTAADDLVSIEEFRFRNNNPIDDDMSETDIFEEAKIEDVSAVLSKEYL